MGKYPFKNSVSPGRGKRTNIKLNRPGVKVGRELSYPRPSELPARFLRASVRVRFFRTRCLSAVRGDKRPCKHPLNPFANSRTNQTGPFVTNDKRKRRGPFCALRTFYGHA